VPLTSHLIEAVDRVAGRLLGLARDRVQAVRDDVLAGLLAALIVGAGARVAVRPVVQTALTLRGNPGGTAAVPELRVAEPLARKSEESQCFSSGVARCW